MAEERDYPKAGELPGDTIPQPGLERDMVLKPISGLSRYRPAGKLTGKAALVTGGDSGIGRAVAIAFAMEGADVAIVHQAGEEVDAADAVRLIEAHGRRCIAIPADLARRDECFRVVAEARAALGGLNVLVNNAAHQATPVPFLELSEEALRRTFDVNILGYMFLAQAALPHMRAGDTVINTGSTTSLMGHPQIIDYAATKGAINVFTRSLALNQAERGIRVNAVLPGPTWTPIIPASGNDPEMVSKFGSQSALHRPAQPEELAPAYVYLASEDSTYTTGTLIEVSGGYIAVG